MKQTGFKKKNYVWNRKQELTRSPFYTLKKSSFKKYKPLTPRKILDGLVSKCVRLGSADKEGMVLCVTCGRSFHWKVIQCGHFQKRGNTSTRYDLKNLGPQCEDCNCFKDGENELFAKFIDEFYGPGTADMLRAQARQIERYYPYQQEIEKWKGVYKKLLEDRGIEYDSNYQM